MKTQNVEVQRSQAAKADELKRKTEQEDMLWLLNDVRGRRVVRRMLEKAGIFRLSFAAENTHQAAFNEGQRNLGLFLNDEILTVAPEQWVNVMKGN